MQAYSHKFRTLIAPAQSVVSGRYVSVLLDLVLSLAVAGALLHLVKQYAFPSADVSAFIFGTTTTETTTTTEEATEPPPTTTTLPPKIANHSTNGTYIRFIETSGVAELPLRQLCSVEAAALHHPGKNVTVGITNKYPAKSALVRNLTQVYPNIQFFALDIHRVLRETDLEKLIKSGHLRQAKFQTEHLIDVLRAVLMLEYGGTYVDLDMLLLKPSGSMMNAIPVVENSSVAASPAIFAVQPNHPVFKWLVQLLTEEFGDAFYGRAGHVLLSEAILKYCKSALRDGILRPLAGCNGLALMPPAMFTPIPEKEWKSLFMQKNAEETMAKMNESYGVHYWNSRSKRAPIYIQSAQPIAQVMRANCPLVATQAANNTDPI